MTECVLINIGLAPVAGKAELEKQKSAETPPKIDGSDIAKLRYAAMAVRSVRRTIRPQRCAG
jgi:hypothetical protein